jgi:hypothetical protein
MISGSLNNYRFSFWLPLFAILLILIPVFIVSGLIGLAKISGILVLVLLILAMRKWFSIARSKNNRVERVQLNANDLFVLQQMIPSYKNWSVSDQRILIDQTGLFLAEVNFMGTWNPKTQLSVAILAVCATWQSGYTNKQHWNLYCKDQTTFSFDPDSNDNYAIPHAPFFEKDILGLQSNEYITPLQKGIALLK